jgi:hypothetical protein
MPTKARKPRAVLDNRASFPGFFVISGYPLH